MCTVSRTRDHEPAKSTYINLELCLRESRSLVQAEIDLPPKSPPKAAASLQAAQDGARRRQPGRLVRKECKGVDKEGIITITTFSAGPELPLPCLHTDIELPELEAQPFPLPRHRPCSATTALGISLNLEKAFVLPEQLTVTLLSLLGCRTYPEL